MRITEAGNAVLDEARRRIDADRKLKVTLRFVDGDGAPATRMPVRVRQTSGDFPFGDQTWPLDRMIRLGTADRDPGVYWKKLFADCLNSATALCYWTERPENDGPKTEDIQGRLRLDEFGAVVRWAASEGLHVKGHPLFWSIPKCWPAWLRRYDTQTQMRFAEVRVRTLLARFGTMVRTWDVVNEALWEAAPQNLESREWPHLEAPGTIAHYVATVLGWARDERPENTYVLNDYGLTKDAPGARIVARDGTVVTAALQRDRLIAVVDELNRRSAMPDALGLQSHTGGLMDPAEQWAVYDQLASTGLPIHITEFWAEPGIVREALTRSGADPSDDAVEAARADYIEQVLTVAYGHHAVEAFSFWGFLDSSVRWSTTDSAHSPGPVYRRVQRLLRETWLTHHDGETDDGGTITFRGFPGEYAIAFPCNAPHASDGDSGSPPDGDFPAGSDHAHGGRAGTDHTTDPTTDRWTASDHTAGRPAGARHETGRRVRVTAGRDNTITIRVSRSRGTAPT